jgi:MFS family permease
VTSAPLAGTSPTDARRIELKSPLVFGCVLTIRLHLAVAHDELWQVVLALGVFGVGTGLVATAMPTIIVMYAPDHQTGAAAGMNMNIRTIGSAIGVQSIAAIIASGLAEDGRPTEQSYVVSFLVLAGVSAVATVAAIAVPSHAHRRSIGVS